MVAKGEAGGRMNWETGINIHTLLLLLLSYFSRVRLCDPIDGSPPGSPIHGIFQARLLEWGAIAFSENLYKCYFLKYLFYLAEPSLS